MRSFEEKKGYGVCKKSEKEKEDYRKLSKEIKGYVPKRIREDITSDIIGSIVYKKLIKNKGSQRNRSRGKPMSFRNFLYAIMIISSITFILYNTFRSQDVSPGTLGNDEHSTNTVLFEDGEKFKGILYFGKNELMTQMVAQITKMVHLMRDLPEKDLLRTMETTQRNFMFWGPPGTGKTIFVRKLVYMVDLNLRLFTLRNNIGDKSYRAISQNERFRLAGIFGPQARVVFVTPSLLNSKYVGETEKNIKNLFNAADNKKYLATIIFIDEADVFFSKREERSQDYAHKAQTEFLNIIGGAQDKPRSRVFVIAATNLFDSIDPAFVRRFSGIFRFEHPDWKEREYIFERFLEDCQDDVKNIYGDLISLSDGMPQSKIIDVLKKTAFNHDGKMSEITREELIEGFENADPAKKGIWSADIHSPNGALKEFYFLDPEPTGPEQMHPSNDISVEK